MRVVLYIPDWITENYKSNLYHVFSDEIRDILNISSSFKGLSKDIYPIFTECSEFIKEKIQSLDIQKYGLILDAEKIKLDIIMYEMLAKSDFAVIIGCCSDVIRKSLKKFSHVQFYDNLVRTIDCKIGSPSISLTDYDSLGELYSLAQNEKLPNSFLVFKGKSDNSERWVRQLANYNITLDFFTPKYSEYEVILKETDFYIGRHSRISKDLNLKSLSNQDISTLQLASLIKSFLEKSIDLDDINNKVVNIVCFNPTYLFKDLVDRFVAKGCIYSDFPIIGANKYIWMRPQEIWHLDYLLSGRKHKEIGIGYQKAFLDNQHGLDIDMFYNIKRRSVAIHHGTCFEPLYQFNYEYLARSLRDVYRVIGVCEFEECYGPSINLANPDNFIFVPIGYDKTLFHQDLVRKDKRNPKELIKIGFVGRAYGTNDKKILNNSKLAEPKGYRKGGDILLQIALKLKVLNVDFEIHILGQNWEELVDLLNMYEINNFYYARDKDITYLDYPKIYRDFDMLLITARCEGGPVSAIEALSLGVDVVSTNVGVVKYLEQKLNRGCYTFNYDRKWHIADTEKAVSNILNIYDGSKSYQDRLDIRSAVLEYDTDNWVDSIISSANNGEL